MNKQKYGCCFCLLIVLLVFCVEPTFAQSVQETSSGSGGYLSAYQVNDDAKPTTSSWWSTMAYLVSLMVVFAFVLGLAYFVSRLLGGKYAKVGIGSEGQILDNLPLGPNRAVCVVEIAGKVMVMGVTEHSITLLQEITDEYEIQQMRSKAVDKRVNKELQNIFSQQFSSLEQISRRIPTIFKDKRDPR
jgi:flagellar protein FliO/FliZ